MTESIVLSADDMRAMYRGGDTFSSIAAKAYNRNHMSRAEVREILIGAADYAVQPKASKNLRLCIR